MGGCCLLNRSDLCLISDTRQTPAPYIDRSAPTRRKCAVPVTSALPPPSRSSCSSASATSTVTLPLLDLTTFLACGTRAHLVNGDSRWKGAGVHVLEGGVQGRCTQGSAMAAARALPPVTSAHAGAPAR